MYKNENESFVFAALDRQKSGRVSIIELFSGVHHLCNVGRSRLLDEKELNNQQKLEKETQIFLDKDLLTPPPHFTKRRGFQVTFCPTQVREYVLFFVLKT